MASACLCAEQGSLADEYRQSRAVFVGRIVSIELATTSLNGDRAENMIATFEIERRWKGPAVRRLRVQTCGTQMMICTCGADFQLGQRYVVFANGKRLETGSCSRTTIVNPEDDEFVKKVNDVAKAKRSNHKFEELQLSKQRLTVANNCCGQTTCRPDRGDPFFWFQKYESGVMNYVVRDADYGDRDVSF